jgi:drug/metabolite transporter (DMT)-like permease
MTDLSTPAWRAWAALAAGVCCLTVSAIFVKWADLPGSTSAFYRALFALALVTPLWLATSRRWPPARTVALVAVGALGLSVDLALWQQALTITSAANATMLVNLAPVWVGIAGAVVLREVQPRRFWWGALLAFAGMAWIVVGRSGGQTGALQGDLMAAAASLFYAVYVIVTRRQRRTLSTVDFLFVSTLVVTLALGLYAWTQPHPLTGFSPRQWLSLAALGLVTHFGAHLAVSYALGHLDAARVSVSILGQPIGTALLALWLLDEPLHLALVVGGGVAVTGLYVALTSRRSRPALPRPMPA